MGKRSRFERNPRDFYSTPIDGMLPLLAHLPPATKFVEPCAGDGRLIRHLINYGHSCVYASDVFPLAEGIDERDALFFGPDYPPCDCIITNPPWGREILHPMIEIFRAQATTWLLFDAAWAFSGQSVPYLRYCKKFVSIGRISWMDNGVSGMDDCAWYCFQKEKCETIFVNNGK